MPFSTMGSQTSFNGGGWIDLIKFIVGGLIWRNMQNEGTGIWKNLNSETRPNFGLKKNRCSYVIMSSWKILTPHLTIGEVSSFSLY
jgi:hypothetical protein